MPRHNGFTCPNCGSHYFGTYRYQATMGGKYRDGASVGCCHGHHLGNTSCRFEWDRSDPVVEAQCIYRQTPEDLLAAEGVPAP